MIATSAAPLTRLQKRFLSRRTCGLCEQPLDREDCGAIWDRSACTPELRADRQRRCLETYKPRKAKP